MKALKLEKNQLDGFISTLKKERNGRMHHRRKLRLGQATFVTANTQSEGEAKLWGRVTGPLKNHADYVVEVTSDNRLVITIDLEDPVGAYTLDQAYEEIRYGITEMMKNPERPEFSGGRSVEHLKGFYLKSTGLKSVGAKGAATLNQAVLLGHISDQFRLHCIQEGFTMEHY